MFLVSFLRADRGVDFHAHGGMVVLALSGVKDALHAVFAEPCLCRVLITHLLEAMLQAKPAEAPDSDARRLFSKPIAVSSFGLATQRIWHQGRAFLCDGCSAYLGGNRSFAINGLRHTESTLRRDIW